MILRKALRSILRFLFRLLSRLDVHGLENVPLEGGFILAVNHLSWLDAPLVYALIDRDNLTAMVADKYKKYALIRPLVLAVRGIWVNREQADFQALRVARDFLHAGGMLGIAPEGTRSRTGGLIAAKTGVAYLAEKAGVPVIPVGVSQTDRAVARLFRFQRPPVHIRFGEPFVLPGLDRRDRGEALRRNTDEIMCQIAALLPPEYRGVYADHPRLKELLVEQRIVRECLERAV